MQKIYIDFFKKGGNTNLRVARIEDLLSNQNEIEQKKIDFPFPEYTCEKSIVEIKQNENGEDQENIAKSIVIY